MSDDVKFLVKKYSEEFKEKNKRIFYDVLPVDWTDAAFTPEMGGDPTDKAVFNINKKNFWDPDKHMVARDLDNWHRLLPTWQTAVSRVFAGLTRLDTVQALVGVPNIKPFSITAHEAHVYNGFEFYESVHAQSYSRIFQTLLSPEKIVEANDWAGSHPTLSAKLAIFERVYRSGDPALIRIASCLFEGFMFWTSFFLPLYMDGIVDKRLQVTATIIKLIMRDEGIHAYYIGYKFQKQLEEYAKLSSKPFDEALAEIKAYYKQVALDLFFEIYKLEFQYTEDLYEDIGLVDEVKKFLHYNANKTFMNLGYNDELFGPDEATPNAQVIALMNGNTTDDIFSGELSSYKILTHGDINDANWDVVKEVFDKRKDLSHPKVSLNIRD